MNRPTRYLLSSLLPPAAAAAARTSHRPLLRFVSPSRPTARLSLSTTAPSKNRPIAAATTRPSAATATMDPRPPEPDPNSGEDFVHIEDPDPNVESLGESFVGVDVAREVEVEDDGEEADRRSGSGGGGGVGGVGDGDGEGSDRRRMTLPEELSMRVLGRGRHLRRVPGWDGPCLRGEWCEASVVKCGIERELNSWNPNCPCIIHLVSVSFFVATQVCAVNVLIWVWLQESCREVEAVISYLKPEVVFLELCHSRAAVLTPQNLKVPTFGEMVEMYKKKHNVFGILYSWFLAKVANKLEVYPGAEFRVAFEEAMKYGGKVLLGDRPVQVTLRRTWAKMPLWHKTKLMYSLLFQAVFLPSPEDLNKMLKDLDDVDMLTLVIQEMSKEFPTLMETLVHERDQ
ncbi:hypothetical protein EUGRSUZ_K00810 [Eucalyptus grandis]|uniref:Uncharacterized protein n=2 Tax=Eucalyptus grandis TaxID=71139 RepID=A0ACC3IRP1_EUCGR|nr:hypothetical protein EUGRSUZ_K00810 [Eucalyptus grandis]